MRLHVSLEQPALSEAFSTGRTGIAATVSVLSCHFGVHADEVAADCVPLHGRILTQVAAVNLLTRLTESVDAQLAFAGEVTLAGGTLEAGVGEM